MSGVVREKRGSAATVRACDLCRKRKRKCIWTLGTEGCTYCTNLEETCTTTHVRKQRAKPQRGNRITEYEDRIQRLEALLQDRTAAQPRITQQPLEPADASVPVSVWVNNLRDEVDAMPRLEIPDFGLWEQADPDQSGLPSQTSINLPKSNSIQSQESGHDSTPLSGDHTLPSIPLPQDAAFFQNTVFEPGDLLSEQTYFPSPLPPLPENEFYLPPPELGTVLLAEYLMDFNTAFPLYRPKVIADHLRICYAGQIEGTSVAWCSTYIVFSFAHMLRAMGATATPQDKHMSKYYLARVFQNISTLLFLPPSLEIVQCLVGVSALLRSSSCGHNLSDRHFISTALRIAQSLAYFEEQATDAEAVRDVEQEYRTTWLAFIHDTHATICSNSPMTHRREDIIAPEPEENPSDALGSVVAAEGNCRFNIFSLRAKLAALQAEAVQQILCLKAPARSALDIDAAVSMVITRLQAFHSQDIFQLDAGQLFQLLYRSDIAHAVCLEASYFATVFRMYAVWALDRNTRVNPFQLEALKRLAKVKDLKCYAEAKRLLSLLPIAPRGDVALYWVNHNIFSAALVTVLAYHLNNPEREPPTRSDLRVYNQVLDDLGTMNQEAGNADIKQVRDFCMGLFLKLEAGLRIQWIQGIAEHNDHITPCMLRGEVSHS